MAVSSVQNINPAIASLDLKNKNTMSNAIQDFKTTLEKFSAEMEPQPVESTKMTLDEMFQKASDTYGVPVKLLKAMAKAESNFNPGVVSSAGAMGVMQLMPGTAKALGVVDPMDPLQNIMGGADYISQKIKKYDGNIELALAAYNAGSGSVAKYGGVPPFKETQNYIKKISGYMNQELNAGTVAYAAQPEKYAAPVVPSPKYTSPNTNPAFVTTMSNLQDMLESLTASNNTSENTTLDVLDVYRQMAASALKIGQLTTDEDKDPFSPWG